MPVFPSITPGSTGDPLYPNPKIITVSKPGGNGQFNSIAAACNSILTASPTNTYLVQVGPGTFTEPQINVPSYVSVTGSTIQPTVVVPDANNHHVFNLSAGCEISFMTINNAGAGFAGIAVIDIGNYGQCHKISMNDCDTGVYIESATVDTIMYMEYVDFNGTYSYGVDLLSQNGFLAYCNTENYYNLPTAGTIYHNRARGSAAELDILTSGNIGTGTDSFLYADGGALVKVTATYAQDIDQAVLATSGAKVLLSGVTLQNATPSGTCIQVDDGVTLRFVGGLISGWDVGIYAPNTGAAPHIAVNAQFENITTYAIRIDHTGATGALQGAFDRTKVLISSSAPITLTAADAVNGGFSTTGKFLMGSHPSELVDVSDLIESGPPMGVMNGGDLSDGGGFVVNVAAGFGYLMSGAFPNHNLLRKDWTSTSITLSANQDVYIYWNTSGILTSNAAFPNTRQNILLGRVVTNGSGIEAIDPEPYIAHHAANKSDDRDRDVFGALFVTGAIVTENATARKLDITDGTYYYGGNKLLPTGGTAITWTKVIRDGSGGFTLTTAQDTVPNTKYDNGTGTEGTVPSNQYARHWLYTVGQSATLKRYLVLSQAVYVTLDDARNGMAPTVPSWFHDGLARVASIITQDGTANIVEIRDERPRLGAAVSAATSVTDHGSLTGLGDDDHPQYLLASGARAMSGGLDMGGNSVTNVNLVDGVDVSAHAARHKHGGADEVATATPAGSAIPKADAFGKLDSWITSGGAAGTPSLRTLGTGATDACAGNDSRLSDARTPTAHAASHQNGGSDEVATATPAANAIPKAGPGATLAENWLPTARDTFGQHFYGRRLDYPNSGFLTASHVQYVRVWMEAGLVLTSMQVFIDSGATGNIQLGIYDQATPSSNNGTPRNLLSSTASTGLVGGDNGTFKNIAIGPSVTITTSGYYWLALIGDSASVFYATTGSYRANFMQGSTNPALKFEVGSGVTLPSGPSHSFIAAASSSLIYVAAVE